MIKWQTHVKGHLETIKELSEKSDQFLVQMSSISRISLNKFSMPPLMMADDGGD